MYFIVILFVYFRIFADNSVLGLQSTKQTETLYKSERNNRMGVQVHDITVHMDSKKKRIHVIT